jgi:predicted RNA-binding protein YlxR (DUF448 family)
MPPHAPIRTCSGTGTKLPQTQLLRFVNVDGVPTPEILLGPYRAPGRGVYVQPTESAYLAAIKRKAFAHKLKTNKPPLSWAEISPHLPSVAD